MWMDIAVGVMAVIAFLISGMCFFEGFRDHESKDQ